jgi:hypothetical protein
MISYHGKTDCAIRPRMTRCRWLMPSLEHEDVDFSVEPQ